MSRRYIYAGLGILAIAAALAVPVIARTGWRASSDRGVGGFPAPNAVVRGAVTIDGAVERVREALAQSGYRDLVPKEVMEFSNHFYVLVVEASTGRGALELLVTRSGIVRPEPGPNMMWNTKYGRMAGLGTAAGPGMMGRRGRTGRGMGPGMMGPGTSGPGMMGPGGPSTGPGWGPGANVPGQAPTETINQERARELAARFLASPTTGATPDEGTPFYGYYTFDVERDGPPIGMLSVNASTGQVWYHSWHGTFVREKDI